MRVSVVTPHFNGSRFLSETGHGLLNQTHQDWEWIIVDDGSHADELALLEEWQQRDSRIRWEPRQGDPKGANHCRNQGWKNANGEHILFLDSDDILLPHALEQRCASIKSSSPSDLILPYFQTVAFRADRNDRWLWDDRANPTSWLASLWSQTPPCQSSGPLWTKAALEATGGWSEDIQVWQDIDIHQKAYFRGIRFVPASTMEPDLLYRIHEGSLSHNSFHSPHKLKSRAQVLHNALQYASENDLHPDEYNSLARMTWSVFRNACTLRNWSAADRIIEASRPIQDISTPFLSRWKLSSKLRTQRLSFIRHELEKQANKLFPKGKRTILTTPYP